MDRLPEGIIGEILSRVSDARQVVAASTTCKYWRSSMQHLKSLSFNIGDFLDLGIERLESIITQTIQQTRRLESLSIVLNGVNVEFSAAQVRVWLMHTRDTLRELNLYVWVHPSFNILEEFQGNKLEELNLFRISISGVELSNETLFPYLKTLKLAKVELSALHLMKLIALCPKVEDLTLIDMDLGSSATLRIGTLKKIYVELETRLDKFLLEAGNLESLELKYCQIEQFKLVGSGSLEVLSIDDCRINYFDIGEIINSLKNVEVISSEIKGPKLYRVMSKSLNLRRLRIWIVSMNDDYYNEFTEIYDSFPQLTHLALYFNEDETHLSLQGSFYLQNLVELELGVSSCLNFYDKVGRFLEKCPNLKKVVIHRIGWEYEFFDAGDVLFLPKYKSSLYQLTSRFGQVQFEFKYC